MHRDVHYSTTHGAQDMGTTAVPLDRWLDKEVVHTYDGISLVHKKRHNTSICDTLPRSADRGKDHSLLVEKY